MIAAKARLPDVAFIRQADGWREGCEDVALRGVAAAFETGGLVSAEGAELSIVFADDAAIRDLNRVWRGTDKPTNVLTFPAVESHEVQSAMLLGDIVLARETIAGEAQAEGKSFDHHLAHLVIHGVLHIYGFDHDGAADADAMENLERKALAGIGIADPYGSPALAREA